MKKKMIVILIIVLLIGSLVLLTLLLTHSVKGEPELNTVNLVENSLETSAEIMVDNNPSSVTKSDVPVTSSKGKSLHVDGTKLVNYNGTPVQLRGISTHGINWFPEYINEVCFQDLQENWNINVIRLAMYTAEYNGYCTGGDKKALKQLIKDGVEYATTQDLYVIIDWHILTDLTPTLYQEDAKKFFAEMSAEFADYDNVLYEICNEPNGGTSWTEIKRYAEEIIPIIRANNENAIIIVGTPNWSQYVNEAAADPITEYDNIMYALHFYAATHKDSLRNTLVNAVESGLPVFVTEYGISEASGDGAIDTVQADKWIELLDSYGISHVAWNLSNKAESSALLKSDCQKKSGFTGNDLKDSGKWIYEMLTNQEPATTIPTLDIPAEISKQDNPVPNGIGENNITYTMNLDNSWESDGSTYYQYSLILTNTDDEKCLNWSISIPFDDAISLSNGWNGNYIVDNNILHITSMDYNGEINADETMENIGFIISVLN